jgi:hypothetical protein
VSPSSAKTASRAAGAALAALLAAAAPAPAGVRLEVGGALEEAAADSGLRVRLDVTNRGDSAAPRLEVEGELFGFHAEGRLHDGVGPGATASLRLDLPAVPPRPGVYALALHLRYPVPGQTETASQRAYLLLALGARGAPAVRVTALATTLETSGALGLDLESADGLAHDVQVRVLSPRGLNALAEVKAVVPAQGRTRATVPLIRTGPSRSERLGVVVLAASTTDGVEDTVAITAVVDLVPHRPWMPRLRIPIAVAAAALLLAALAFEFRRR